MREGKGETCMIMIDTFWRISELDIWEATCDARGSFFFPFFFFFPLPL